MEGHINVMGGKVWYKIVGKKGGVPLVALHGGPGFPHNYLEPLEELGDEREVIFYDQLGCGKSDRPEDTNLWTVDRFVAELGQVINALGLKEYHLLGQSWGAALAVSFALTKPVGLKSLVLADPYLSSPRWMEDAKKLKEQLPNEIQQVLKKNEEKGTTDSKEYRDATEKYYENFVFGMKDLPKCFLDARAGMGNNVYNAMWGPEECFVLGNLRDFDLTEKLSQLSLPVLFLCGRYDEATPETVKFFQSLVPNARIRVFENSAHLPFLTEKSEFIETVRKFLKEIR